ncbi:MAG: hypothetical protein ACYC5J_15515 [Chloroflexota bacterium]
MRNTFLALVLGAIVTMSWVLPALAQPKSEFKLGFKAVADQVPEVVGLPLEDEHWGANGDSLQRTTTGLMVWRKADNWTAFTDGSRTWINGPEGLKDRGNDERFPWEAEERPAAGSTSAPVMAAAPAGRVVFVSRRDGNDEIYVMNPDGSAQTRLTNSPTYDGGPGWSPDGGRIAFATKRDGNDEIYVMKADGTGQTRLTNHPGNDLNPAWSPDRSSIAFSSHRDGAIDIYVMNADGSGLRRLTHGEGGNSYPAWSPDGSRIAFSSTRDGSYEIYVMRADGSGQTRLTTGPTGGALPIWSPDGSRIAFNANRDGNLDVYVMNPDGSGQTRLTDHPAPDYHPSWLPDGRIVFASGRDGNDEICVMNADGSGQTRLTNSPAYDAEPAAAVGPPFALSPSPVVPAAPPAPTATAVRPAPATPTATPPDRSPQDPRPATGTFLRDGGRTGSSRLVLENGQNLDAVAVLTTPGGTPLISVYIRARESFTITRIRDGDYQLYFVLGEGWDNASARFTANADYCRAEGVLTFQYARYPGMQVTLHAVPEGNLGVGSVDPSRFPSIR